jgi:hypothetical protein
MTSNEFLAREINKIYAGKIEDWAQRLRLAYPPWTRTDEFEEICNEMEKCVKQIIDAKSEAKS